MAEPRKTCRRCASALLWETVAGTRVYRLRVGVRIYSARCPRCGPVEVSVG